jgi:4-amino-4-deoxy-L-arabinose transferase-like glycosyltransferase
VRKPHIWRGIVFSDLGILILLALTKVLLHTLTNGQYGFHRDELATLDNARYLDWGYVAYPPITPFITRVALEAFGPSLVGVRFFAALAQGISMILAGLMACEMGGTRLAQAVAAITVGIAPAALGMGTMLMYISFDYLWWVLVAYLTIRLLRSENQRWWIGIGAVIGLGMMTKYTMAFCVMGIVIGVLLTRIRRHLFSPWLWGGVAISLLIFLLNLIWQLRHDFISLEFLSNIHNRDIAWGRTGGYIVEQLFVSANPFTIPVWIAGLYFYFFAPQGKRFRLVSWMYIVPLVLFLVLQGRSYYLSPAYPMLLAAGSVFGERWFNTLKVGPARIVRRITWWALAVGGSVAAVLVLPIAPINSTLWNLANEMHDNFAEQIGWPELVETIADIYTGLPVEERSLTGILTINYGEAGAVNLYGPVYGLPEAISGMNSYWWRGYGNPPPHTLIVVGYNRDTTAQFFELCNLAGHIENRYGVENEETMYFSNIFVCRGLRDTWPEFWRDFQDFG